jgi:hypothetical protein
VDDFPAARDAAHPGDPTAGRADDFLERVLHVFGLQDLVLAPLKVEAQHGDAPLIHRDGIDFTVALLVGDHLAASGEMNIGAVDFADIALEVPAVAAAQNVVRSA